jgi:hypothetical protein
MSALWKNIFHYLVLIWSMPYVMQSQVYDAFRPSLCLWPLRLTDFGFHDDSIDATSLPRPHTEWIIRLPEMLKLREHQCSQDAWIFLGSKRFLVYFCHCGQWYSLTYNWSMCGCSQLTFSKDSETSLLYNFFLIMVTVLTITLMNNNTNWLVAYERPWQCRAY